MREWCLFCERPLSPGATDYCGPLCRRDHWMFLLVYDFWVKRDPAVEQLAWHYLLWVQGWVLA
jgi:hypothetical protein